MFLPLLIILYFFVPISNSIAGYQPANFQGAFTDQHSIVREISQKIFQESDAPVRDRLSVVLGLFRYLSDQEADPISLGVHLDEGNPVVINDVPVSVDGVSASLNIAQEVSKIDTGPLILIERLLESMNFEPLFFDNLAHLFLPSLFDTGNNFSTVLEIFINKRTSGYSKVREKFFDDEIIESLGDVEQVVFLGVGYDTRAYRMEGFTGKSVFEADFDQVIERRKSVLSDLGQGTTVIRIPLVVGEEGWQNKLLENGLDKGKKTLFVVQGLTMYFEESQAESFFTGIEDLVGSGDVILADFIVPQPAAEKIGVMKFAISPNDLLNRWSGSIVFPGSESANYGVLSEELKFAFFFKKIFDDDVGF